MANPPHTRTRILVARLDRLGDVLMTLPSLAFLRQAFPTAEIDFACRTEWHALLRPFLAQHEIQALAPATEGSQWLARLKARGYRGSLLLHPPNSLVLACWRAAIPVRVRGSSKVFSAIFSNTGQRQKRSYAAKNEAEYNLELARALSSKLGGKQVAYVPPIQVGSDGASVQTAHEILNALGVEVAKPYIVIHPGMGQSALNLDARSYSALIQILRKLTGYPILLSVGPTHYDQAFSETILAKERHLHVLEGLALPVLREVFRTSFLVVAPSTGPLHLAHLVGAKTLGVYSPIRSQRKDRWAPWGGTGESHILVPEVSCPATRKCLGAKCEFYPCLDRQFDEQLRSQTEGVLRKVIEG